MTESLQARLDRLEALYSEQDYTIHALNDMIAQQDREISQLNLSIVLLRDQLQVLKSDLTGEIVSEPEKPPHY